MPTMWHSQLGIIIIQSKKNKATKKNGAHVDENDNNNKKSVARDHIVN